MGEHHRERSGAIVSGRHWAEHVAVVAATLIIAPVPALVASSHGYSWSLLIFLLPIAVILAWFTVTPQEELKPVRRAFLWTITLLAGLGFLLNLLFADNFFVYENPDAVLGFWVPVLHGMSFSEQHAMPVEELVFYTTGFVAMLLIYIWGCESFFAEYRPREYLERARRQPTVFQFSISPVIVVMGMVAAATALKQLWNPGDGAPPWYLIYLLTLPLLVSILFGRVALEFVNWRAFSFMFVVLLADSVLWEASLAMPQRWWGYRQEVMIGLTIAPWHDLPIEAVLVWVLAPFATVVTFEAMKLLLHHPEPLRGHLWRALRRPPSREPVVALEAGLLSAAAAVTPEPALAAPGGSALPGAVSALPGAVSALPGAVSALPGAVSALPGAGSEPGPDGASSDTPVS